MINISAHLSRVVKQLMGLLGNQGIVHTHEQATTWRRQGTGIHINSICVWNKHLLTKYMNQEIHERVVIKW